MDTDTCNIEDPDLSPLEFKDKKFQKISKKTKSNS